MDLHPSWSSFSEWQILKSGSSMINYTTKIVLSHLILKKNKSNENQVNPNQINIWLWQDVQLCLNKWNKHDNNNKKNKPRPKEINHQK